MGFLHLGWDIAAKEDLSDNVLGNGSPAWVEVAKHVDLTRPGMAAVIRTMGWQPLHLAAMEGKVSLVRTLVQQLDCNLLGRSANSWTPMHYAAAHNQVGSCKGMQTLVRMSSAHDDLHLASHCISKPLYWGKNEIAAWLQGAGNCSCLTRIWGCMCRLLFWMNWPSLDATPLSRTLYHPHPCMLRRERGTFKPY